jgi:hypothetical protein
MEKHRVPPYVRGTRQGPLSGVLGAVLGSSLVRSWNAITVGTVRTVSGQQAF